MALMDVRVTIECTADERISVNAYLSTLYAKDPKQVRIEVPHGRTFDGTDSTEDTVRPTAGWHWASWYASADIVEAIRGEYATNGDVTVYVGSAATKDNVIADIQAK